MGKHRKTSGRPPADYDVGYGKPPKHSQFKPGTSGNKKGRPRKNKTLNEERMEMQQALVPVALNGQRKMLPRQTLVLTALYGKAMQGDIAAIRLLFGLEAASEGSTTSTGIPESLSPEDRALLADYLRMTEPAGEASGASLDDVPAKEDESGDDGHG